MRKFFTTPWNELTLGSLLSWGGAFWERPMRLDTQTDVPVAFDLRQQTGSGEQFAHPSATYTIHTDPEQRTAYTGSSEDNLPVPHRASA